MKARTIIFLVGLVLVGMFIGNAKASELENLLQGKMVEYNGTCRFDQHDMLVFDDRKVVKVVRCLVGFVPPDTDDLKYILLYLNDEPVVLLEYSVTKKAQRVLWKRGGV